MSADCCFNDLFAKASGFPDSLGRHAARTLASTIEYAGNLEAEQTVKCEGFVKVCNVLICYDKFAFIALTARYTVQGLMTQIYED